METSSFISNFNLLRNEEVVDKSFICSCCIVRSGQSWGGMMWWVSQHTLDLMGPKLRYLADEVDADVVLFGASRCHYHYVPSILADSIGLSVYNGGITASDCIYSHYFALNLILEHHTPKMICLELMAADYAVAANSFEAANFFAPYIGRSERGDSVFREAGNYRAYHLCHLYRYNARALSNIAGLFINRQQGEDSGYLPLPCPKATSLQVNLEEHHTTEGVDELKLRYLRKFIELCRSRNIALVFMVSPAYSVADADLYDPLKEVAKKYEIPFLDYHTQGLFLEHPEYFKDKIHLWDKGVRLYTSIFAHDLKQLIPLF